MMNKVKLVILLVLAFFYLFFSYIRFYHFVGDLNLQSPFLKTSIELENPQAKGNAKYVALGDSLSAGVGSSNVNDTFVYQYALKLSKKYEKINLINLAQPGGTTVDVIQNQLSQTVIEKPDYVTLLIGINDIHNKRTVTDFSKKYLSILEELLNKTNAQITIINIPYLGSNQIIYPPFNFLLNFRIKQFNKTIQTLVTQINDSDRVKLIDLYQGTYSLFKQNPNYYSSDLFHPSNEGYLLWGQIINAN